MGMVLRVCVPRLPSSELGGVLGRRRSTCAALSRLEIAVGAQFPISLSPGVSWTDSLCRTVSSRVEIDHPSLNVQDVVVFFVFFVLESRFSCLVLLGRNFNLERVGKLCELECRIV